MKEQLEKYKFEIMKEIVDFIDEYEDPELANRIYKASLTEAVDDEGKGDINKTFVALASVVSQFIKMSVKIAKRDCHEEFTHKQLSDNFHKILDAYCQIADLEEEINRKENNDGQGDTEANTGD